MFANGCEYKTVKLWNMGCNGIKVNESKGCCEFVENNTYSIIKGFLYKNGKKHDLVTDAWEDSEKS